MIVAIYARESEHFSGGRRMKLLLLGGEGALGLHTSAAQILVVDAHGSPRQSGGPASRFSVAERSTFGTERRTGRANEYLRLAAESNKRRVSRSGGR